MRINSFHCRTGYIYIYKYDLKSPATDALAFYVYIRITISGIPFETLTPFGPHQNNIMRNENAELLQYFARRSEPLQHGNQIGIGHENPQTSHF